MSALVHKQIVVEMMTHLSHSVGKTDCLCPPLSSVACLCTQLNYKRADLTVSCFNYLQFALKVSHVLKVWCVISAARGLSLKTKRYFLHQIIESSIDNSIGINKPGVSSTKIEIKTRISKTTSVFFFLSTHCGVQRVSEENTKDGTV